MIKDIIKKIFVVILLALFYSCSANPTKSTDSDNSFIQITDNWQYRFGKSPVNSNGMIEWANDSLNSEAWISINNFKEIPSKKGNQTLWLRTALPNTIVHNPAIFIKSMQQIMQVYLDDELIYQVGDFNLLDKSIPIGYTKPLIILPDNFQDKTITFRIYSSISKIGFNNFPLLGTGTEITKDLFINNIDELVLTTIYLIVGIILLFTFFYFKSNKLFLGLSLYLISLSLWIASNSQYLQLIFNYPHEFYLLDHISLFSVLIGPFYFAEKIIDQKYKKSMRLIWQANVAYLIVSLILELLPGNHFENAFYYYLVIFFVICILGFILMVLSVRKGNFQTRLFVAGISFSFLCGAIEIIIYAEDSQTYSPVLVHIGSFILVIVLTLVLFYEYKHASEQKELAQQRTLEAVNNEKKIREKYTQRLITATEKERKRISFELHDAVGQDLLVIKNMTRLVKKNLSDTETAEEFLNDISEAADNSIQDVRDISRYLHPYQLDKLGLTAAVNSLITKVENRSKLNLIIDIDKIDGLFEKENEIHIYRIVQESINNILKHSNADKAEISIKLQQSKVSIIIKDNGKGFDIKNNSDKNNFSFGLNGISERVLLLNGTFNIKSILGKGTEIKIDIQL